MELSSQTNLGQERISDGPVIQCKIVTYRLHSNGHLFGVLEYIIFLAILFCSAMVQSVPQLLSPQGNMQYPVYKDIYALILEQIHRRKEIDVALLSHIVM